MSKDPLGDEIKFYENRETDRKLMPLLPVVVRLDGKCFSKFTKNLKRPFDRRLHDLMILVTKTLMQETNAAIGYTQSDEITLGWHITDPKQEPYFGGRIFKITADLASIASVTFNKNLPSFLPEKQDQSPRFDCRVFNVPTQELFYKAFLWRELDASKNSVSMAARTVLSHKACQNLSSAQMQDKMMEKGVNWNDYDVAFKRGTYVQRFSSSVPFTSEEISKLPPKHEARLNPNLVVTRQLLRTINPRISKLTNPIDFLLYGKEPITLSS